MRARHGPRVTAQREGERDHPTDPDRPGRRVHDVADDDHPRRLLRARVALEREPAEGRQGEHEADDDRRRAAT